MKCDLALLTDYILVYSVNLRVDYVQLRHPEHSRHGLGLDCPQVRVVYGQLLAVKESSEGVGDQLEEVEKVQLEMFHCFKPVEGVLTNDRAEIRSFSSDYTAKATVQCGQQPLSYTGDRIEY